MRRRLAAFVALHQIFRMLRRGGDMMAFDVGCAGELFSTLPVVFPCGVFHETRSPFFKVCAMVGVPQMITDV
jgi:hypothetical protein